jgi:hypothetical protein
MNDCFKILRLRLFLEELGGIIATRIGKFFKFGIFSYICCISYLKDIEH